VSDEMLISGLTIPLKHFLICHLQEEPWHFGVDTARVIFQENNWRKSLWLHAAVVTEQSKATIWVFKTLLFIFLMSDHFAW